MGTKYDIDTVLGSFPAEDILELIEPQIEILAEISTDLVGKDAKGNYFCKLVDNEIRVREKFPKKWN